MAWKGVHLTQPSRLSLCDGQLVVAQDETVRVALEDIGWIIVDNPRTTVTASLMSACMSSGIAIVLTDERHLPSGMALPFHRHHRQSAVAERQIALSLPLRKRLWQSIVRQKILNQAFVLDELGRQGGASLRAMATRVGSGDPDNVEARAARSYWSALFDDFTRSDEADRRNKLLNYGYAVARAGLARALAGAGFLPSIGIKHASDTNAFNLADDLIEPLRPLVDRQVFAMTGPARPASDAMTVEDRRAMAGVLLGNARVGAETMTMLAASERTVESLGQAIEKGDRRLLALPEPSGLEAQPA